MNQYKFYQSDVRPEGKLFIGSSDIPVIIKTKNSKIKKSSYELWEEKTGKAECWQGNEATSWGSELEPLLLAKFIREFANLKTAYRFKIDYMLHQEYRKEKYIPATNFHPFTESVHPQFEWAIAHADCIACNGFDKPFLIEAKTGGYFARVRRDGIEGFDLDDHSSSGVPTDVLLQVQWQMLCYDIDMTYVLLLVDDNKFHVYEVSAIKKWWPLMLEKASRFYNYCITDKPPQPEKYDDVKGLFPEVKDKAVYMIGEQAIIANEMLEEKKRIQEKMKRMQNRLDDINDAAGLLIGESKYLYNGETNEKLFQQVIMKDQYNMIHPSTIKKEAEEAFKILESKGLIKKSDRRFIR
jgi:hypothetical protein